MREKEKAEFLKGVPAHLRFFFELPPKELDAEELTQFLRQRLAQMREHRDELTAHGIPVDQLITDTESDIEALAASNMEVSKAEDTLLNLQADLADTEYDLFKHLQKTLKTLEEENPFHPDVEGLREQVEEMAKHFPKE